MCGDSIDIDSRTAEQYVRGIAPIDLSDDTIANIFIDQNVSPEALVSDMDMKTKMLLKAEVYMACASMPSVRVSIEDSDGNWKHKEGGGQISDADKKLWVSIANSIYAQYGVIRYASSGPRIHAMGMRTWRKGNGC